MGVRLEPKGKVGSGDTPALNNASPNNKRGCRFAGVEYKRRQLCQQD